MKKIRKIINHAWGWALLGEGFMWQYIVSSNILKNEKLQEIMSFRSLSVSVMGANLLTDGWAFPWIKTAGRGRRGAQEAGKNQGGK